MKSAIRSRVEPILSGVGDFTFDDLFDEALITLHSDVKSGKLNDSNCVNLSGYIYTICYRLALKKARRPGITIVGGTTVSMTGEDGEPVLIVTGVEQDQDPDEQYEQYMRALAFLEEVLSKIPLNCKQIFRRFYWDNLPMDEIASSMGLKNANTAKTTKNRCMDKFKTMAKDILSNDSLSEDAVRTVVEREALRDMLARFRKEESGDIAVAACDNTESEKDS
ncbi:MAG: hypothetical protein MJY67_05370 [Bacteroidales bacterium]|nr:hypothetical protein [Bacteroidales bacterium]